MSIQRITLACCLICLISAGSRAQQNVPPPPKPADEGPSLEATMKFIQDTLNDIGSLKYSVGRRAVDADHDSVFDETDELTNVVADPQRCTISYRHQESAGPLRSEVSSRNSVAGVTQEVAYAQVPAASYPSQGSGGSVRSTNGAFVVDLKQVRKITVRSAEQDLNEASGGKTVWTVRPSIFDVVAQSHLAGYHRQLPGSAVPPVVRPAVPGPPRAVPAPAPRGAIIGGIVVVSQPQPSGPLQGIPGAGAGPLPRERGVFSVDDEELAKRLARALLHAVELCTPDKKSEPF